MNKGRRRRRRRKKNKKKKIRTKKNKKKKKTISIYCKNEMYYNKRYLTLKNASLRYKVWNTVTNILNQYSFDGDTFTIRIQRCLLKEVL